MKLYKKWWMGAVAVFGVCVAASGSVPLPVFDVEVSAVLQRVGEGRVASARVIVDNQEAFKSKVDFIQKATRSIRMVYYIYADDESSSYLTQMLIEKAQSGVNVDLLVDLHTNYLRMDLFRMMEEQGRDRSGQQKLRVYFFNGPNEELVRDITFMTSDCEPKWRPNEKGCRAHRLTQAEHAALAFEKAKKSGRIAELPFMTSLFFAGLYAKNPAALRASIALGSGEDLKEIKKIIDEGKNSDSSYSSEDMAQLKELLRLLAAAKISGSMMAKLQLSIALAAYGDQVRPIIDMFDKIVPDTMKDASRDFSGWIHLTDFVHHKLLVVDDRYIQLGGRNIENSYHLNKKISANDKYLFRDTDSSVVLNQPDTRVGATFDKMIRFRSMVLSLPEVLSEFDNSLLVRLDAIGAALVECAEQRVINISECVHAAYLDADKGIAPRLALAKKSMEVKAAHPSVVEVMRGRGQEFWGSNGTDELSQADLAQLDLRYLENLPYDKNEKNPTQRLMFQSTRENESAKAKHIHRVVEEGIRRVCQAATNDFKKVPIQKRAQYLENPANKRRILIHQGYVIFPAELTQLLGSTVSLSAVSGGSGQLHCPNVEFEILTNSVATTDLSVINFFAGLQLGSLLHVQSLSEQHYAEMVKDKFKASRFYPPARIRYFELQPPILNQEVDVVSLASLHTKVFIFDRLGFYVGSANGDVRSYYMDSNNGFVGWGGSQFVSQYMNWVDGQKATQAGRQPVYIEKTRDVLGLAAQVVRLTGRDQAHTNQQRRDYLKSVYGVELEKMAAHFAAKWRSQVANGTDEEKAGVEERIAKVYKHLPTVARLVASINVYVLNASSKFINRDVSAEELQAASVSDVDAYLKNLAREFNLRFEIL